MYFLPRKMSAIIGLSLNYNYGDETFGWWGFRYGRHHPQQQQQQQQTTSSADVTPVWCSFDRNV